MISFNRQWIISVFLVFLGLLASCSGSNEEFSRRFYQHLQPVYTMTHGYQFLRLDSLTDFKWDSVYFFKGAADAAYISHTIGFTWQGKDLQEDYRRLLFVRGQQVVSYTDFPTKGEVYPDKLPMPIYLFTCQQGYGLGRAQARLAIFRACVNGGTFAIVPLACFKEAYLRNLLEQGCTDETMTQLRGPHLFDSLSCIIPIPDTNSLSRRPLKE